MFDNGVLPGDMMTDKHGMSNALVVSGSKTASGHPVAVFGPQTGYFAPQLLMLQELQGPGISARGASFAGISMYVLLGRGQDYSWSATTSAQDIIDTFALPLCDPSGKPATKDSNYYAYQGQCLPMDTVERKNSWSPTVADGTAAGSYTLRSYRTKYGPVLSRATVGGKPVAYTPLRSSYFHEVDSLIGFQELNDPGFVHIRGGLPKGRERRQLHVQLVLRRLEGHRVLQLGRNPVRNPNIDPNMPVWGDQGYDWQGWNRTATSRRTRRWRSTRSRSTRTTTSAGTTRRPRVTRRRRRQVRRVPRGPARLAGEDDDPQRHQVTRVNLTQAMEDAALADLRGGARCCRCCSRCSTSAPVTGAAGRRRGEAESVDRERGISARKRRRAARPTTTLTRSGSWTRGGRCWSRTSSSRGWATTRTPR